MANHLLILDGLNLIRRIYAVQERQSPTEELALAGTRQNLIRTINKLLDATSPTHVVAVFDGQLPSWRHDLYPSYKANRKPMPQALADNLEDLQDAIWSLGIESLLSDGDEADDLIATLACTMARHQQLSTIVSTDKGFCQLLAPQIQLRDYFNQRWFDLAYIDKEFGLDPSQLVDYWALVGNSSSDIPGVAGIGPKTARQLLQTAGSIDKIVDHEQISEKLRQKVQDHWSELQIYRQLSRLQQDIPLGFNLKDLRWSKPA